LVQLIKKGGLRERANRSRKYSNSENNRKTLEPHRYTQIEQSNEKNTILFNENKSQLDTPSQSN